jgi:hypothetical protein
VKTSNEQPKRRVPEATLIFIRATTIGSRQFHFGEQAPLTLLSDREIGQGIDAGILKEFSIASYYRRFHLFCSK